MGMMLSGAGGLVFKGTVRPDRAAPLLDDDAGFLERIRSLQSEAQLEREISEGKMRVAFLGDRYKYYEQFKLQKGFF
ncbi:MAG: hypothetical protein U1E46_00380 [Hyphomicrobiales bacterium]